MADTIKFQCDLARLDVSVYGIPVKENADTTIPLGFEVLLDGKSMFKTEHVVGPCKVTFDIDDDETIHKLQFVMTGKTQENTVINEHGEITSDALLKISNFEIDEIVIDQLLSDKLEYAHNFNGTQSPIIDKFHGTMGCNGTLTFEFTTPFYLWLLEHM
tara:strand:+ start:411 stop:887 length:477 start_codon:yes stop_codon:yes gene_type:complete